MQMQDSRPRLGALPVVLGTPSGSGVKWYTVTVAPLRLCASLKRPERPFVCTRQPPYSIARKEGGTRPGG